MPKLAIRKDKKLDREVELTGANLRIGRGDQNEIILSDPTKEISRFHAELRFEDGAYVLIDLNSQNGLWVRELRQTRIALEPNVPVTLGPYTLTIEAIPLMAGDTLRPLIADTIIGQKPVADSDDTAATPRAAVENRQALATKKVAPKRSRAILYAGLGFVAVTLFFVAIVIARSNRMRTDPVDPPGATAVPAEPSSSTVISTYIADAKALIDRNELDAAVATLDKVLAIENGHAEANELRSSILAQKAAADAAAAEQPPVVGNSGADGPKTAPPPAVRPPPASNCRPGERPADCLARDRELATRYEAGRSALASESWQSAIASLSAVVQDDSEYKDAALLLSRARDGARADAQRALEAAAKAESAGDLVTAQQQYLRAVQLDSSQAAFVDLSLGRVRAVMKTGGTDAFKRARQHDALGRIPEAVALYEQAYRFLPDGDPNKSAAKERLDALRIRQ